MFRSWGLVGGKIQQTELICQGKNSGRANATDAEAQAEREAERAIRLRLERGFTYDMPKAGTKVVNAEVELRNLPKAFCPSKPISKCPTKVAKGADTFGQRKYNGNCFILAKTDEGNKVYSRRMVDLTPALGKLPIVVEAHKKMNEGQMINTEFFYTFKKSGLQSTKYVGSIGRTKNPDEVLEKYINAERYGTFQFAVFDILFDDYIFVGNSDYLTERHPLLEAQFGCNDTQTVFVPELLPEWSKLFKTEIDEDGEETYIPGPKVAGWEGFVLRVPGEKSYVKYSLNGKPERAGAWKFKFGKEGDFIVTEAWFGEGKYVDVYATFHLGQYDEAGAVVDCGNCGPGKLKFPEIQALTAQLLSGKEQFPFVVEIKFRDWQEGSSKLEHAVIQRIRFDKPLDECLYEGE